jgi:hypothetical protein
MCMVVFAKWQTKNPCACMISRQRYRKYVQENGGKIGEIT